MDSGRIVTIAVDFMSKQRVGFQSVSRRLTNVAEW